MVSGRCERHEARIARDLQKAGVLVAFLVVVDADAARGAFAAFVEVGVSVRATVGRAEREVGPKAEVMAVGGEHPSNALATAVQVPDRPVEHDLRAAVQPVPNEEVADAIGVVRHQIGGLGREGHEPATPEIDSMVGGASGTVVPEAS